MGKEHKNYPPIETRGRRIRTTVSIVALNVVAAAALTVVLLLGLSFLFSTPEEYRTRQANNALRREYDALDERLGEIEAVLGNAADRDRNVFLMLFESEPYDSGSGDYEASRWQSREELLTKTNNELADILNRKLEELALNEASLKAALTETYTTMAALGEQMNNIPSIQPIINDDLTLLTASFGRRIQPYYKVLTMHNGVDYTVPEGTRVFATADGKVTVATSRPSTTGNTIVINHGNGYETHYNHLSRMVVRQGQQVRRGDIIALTGDTGLSLLPHLHYEIRYNGTPVDPVHYFFAELDPWEYDRIIQIAGSGMQSFD